MPTRKSLSELAASGTLTKHRGRYQSRIDAAEKATLPIGRPPGHLLATEKAIWSETVKNAPAGLLGRGDRLMVEVLCKLMARTRAGEFKTSDINSVSSILSKLGLSPADRARLGVEQQIDPAATEAEKAEQAALDELDQLDD